MFSTRTRALERWNTDPDVTRACSQVRKTPDKTRTHLSTSSPSSEGASLMQGLWPTRYINLACRPAFGEVCSAGSSTGAAMELWGERDLLGARCCSSCGQDVLGSARRELSLVAEVPFVSWFCLQTISGPVCVITRFLGVIFGSYSNKIKPWPQISVGVSLVFPPLYLYYCSTPRKKKAEGIVLIYCIPLRVSIPPLYIYMAVSFLLLAVSWRLSAVPGLSCWTRWFWRMPLQASQEGLTCR